MPSDAFVELVRDALQHLYDLPHLQRHPLLGAVQPAPTRDRGSALRQALLDAIESLQVGGDARADSRSWRPYRILELRYIEGRGVPAVMSEVALGKTQYHREHQRALVAVASVLADRWGVADDDAPPPDGAGDGMRGGRARSSVLEVVGGVVELLEPLCTARGVRLEVSLPKPDVAACADRVALRHALIAVLMPSIRLAADAHSGALTLAVALVRDAVELRVSCQADLSSAEVGLGEARTLLDPVGGDVHLSREGRWSTVRLLLPGASRRTLLVVDNNPDFIRLMQRFLTDRDWEVVGAADVDQAESLAREHPPDAILLDVVMPGRDGLDLLVALKRSVATADIPVFVCSVLHEAEVATSLGAAAYLQKPVTQTDLIEALATIS